MGQEPSAPQVAYRWDIFQARGVRSSQLRGTPYRYWSSFAITHELAQRLSGRIDFLDAGGRDGGTLELLKNLELGGTYTCLDLEPKCEAAGDTRFAIEMVRSPFREYRPARQFDAILFQSCLECVESYQDIAWAKDALKPGGFVVATIARKNTRRLYAGFWKGGGKYLMDEGDLAPAFAAIGLRVVEIYPLGGAASRGYQTLWHTHAADFARRVYRKLTGMPEDPLARVYGLANAVAARIDRVLPFWRTGHCIVLERA